MKNFILILSLFLTHSCSWKKQIFPSRTVACVDCEKIEPIDQSIVTQKDYCSGNQKGTDRKRYSNGVYDNETGVSVNVGHQEEKGVRIISDYDVYSEQMGPSSTYYEEGVEYQPDEYIGLMYPKRVLSNQFFGRGKEGSFDVIDSPVRTDFEGKSSTIKGRYVSTDMRITEYSMFPRKFVPAMKLAENQIILMLTTGEEIVLDKNTGRIISGVAQEVAPKVPVENRVDAGGNKNIRQYPDSDFQYQGEGLYIETHVTYSKDEKKPGNLVPVRAMVDGKMQECKLKSDDIWINSYGYYLPQSDENFLSSGWTCTRYKFERDEDLYQLIKKKCPTFKFPKLTK